MKVLLIGKNGQLASSILSNEKASFFNVHAYGKDQLDIKDMTLVREVVNREKPNILINAAAYTNVENSEKFPSEAYAINSEAVYSIAKICRELNTLLIHVSTDYVFDGEKETAYIESDKVNPINVYGKSKLEGEKNILKSGCDYIIIRTSWVFSEFGNNFVKTMLDLFTRKNEIDIVSDQYGCPTYAGDIANVIFRIIEAYKEEKVNKIYHYSGCDKLNWSSFAKKINCYLKSNNYNISCPIINEITSEDFNSLAKRPKNSYLLCSSICKDFNVSQHSLSENLPKVINYLLGE